MTTAQDFADYVRSIRDRLGLSQEMLAQRLKVSTSTVQKWEQGTSRPHVHIRRRLDRLSR